MFRPSVSIIIPVYNVAPYIEKCLRTVVSQSYKGVIECVIIDDCGQDESITKAKDLIDGEFCTKKGVRFRVLRHNENRGLSAARNTGLVAATGEYVFFLDSDDWLDIDCIQGLVNVLEKYPASQVVQAGVIKSDGTIYGQDLRYSAIPDYIDNPITAKSLILKRVIPCMAFPRLLKRDFLIKNRLFFHEGYLNEDELWRFFVAKKIETISICRSNVYVYNVREGSIMTTVSKKRQESVLAICNDMINNIDPVCKKEQVSMIAHILQDAYYCSVDEEFKKRCLQYIKRLRPHSSALLYIRLYIFEKLSIKSIRQTKIGSYLFYKFTSIDEVC